MAYYPYLISSLAMLHFGMKPPFSCAKFIDICSGFIPENDREILNSVPLLQIGHYQGRHPVLMQWQEFEIALRNELVKVRSGHLRVDSQKFMRQSCYSDPALSHVAMNAFRNPSVLEKERILDLGRWNFLDGLTFGHYFDLDVLIVYALKLLILERWEKVNTAQKTRILEDTLARA